MNEINRTKKQQEEWSAQRDHQMMLFVKHQKQQN
jgi:hypothetical protein